MLIEFTAENYRSIQDRLTLSLAARAEVTEHPERLMTFKKDRILPQIMILGPNASGKSSILMALATGIEILKRSVYLQPKDPVPYLEPFRFDSSSAAEPSSFEYIFTVDGQRFRYGFTVSSGAVLEEFLYSWTRDGRRESESVQFERKNEDYYFPVRARRLRKLTEMTAANKLFLAVASQFNDSLCQKVFAYLTGCLIRTSSDSLELETRQMLENAGDAEKKEILRRMNSADLFLDGFIIRPQTCWDEDVHGGPARRGMPARTEFQTQQKAGTEDSSKTYHRVGGIRYTMPLKEESAGMRRYLHLLPKVLDALEYGRTLCVDDLDSHLHPMLLREIMALFNDPQSNRNQAQLIFTARDALLLEIGDCRKDQIFLTEKSRQDESTSLFSLADFSLIKDENILASYLIGRYGALPQVTQDWIDAAPVRSGQEQS